MQPAETVHRLNEEKVDARLARNMNPHQQKLMNAYDWEQALPSLVAISSSNYKQIRSAIMSVACAIVCASKRRGKRHSEKDLGYDYLGGTDRVELWGKAVWAKLCVYGPHV